MTHDGRVELVHLGTGHALPDPARGPTATLLRTPAASVLIDAGSGTLQKLHAAGAHLLTLDALLLTHAHLDHLADLAPLLFALTIPGMERTAPLRIVATAETQRIVDAMAAAFGHWLRPPEAAVVWTCVEPGDTVQIGDVRVVTAPVQHTASSVGFALECGDVRVAIPGDTGPCEGLVALLRGARYAIVECSLPDAMPIEGHLTPSTLAAAANEAGVVELAVVHRYPLALTVEVEQQLQASCAARVRFPDDGDVVVLRGA